MAYASKKLGEVSTSKNSEAASASLWKTFWIDESERMEGLAKVEVWTRPIKLEDEAKDTSKRSPSNSQESSFTAAFNASKVRSEASVARSSAAFSRYITSLRPFSHWAILFKWDEVVKDECDDVIFPKKACYEGFDDGGKLVPFWSQNPPEGDDWTVTNIGEITISPKKVNVEAKKLWCNEIVYTEALQNCQLWVKALWRKLKPGEDIELGGVSMIPRAIVGVATAATAVVPAIVAGAGALAAADAAGASEDVAAAAVYGVMSGVTTGTSTAGGVAATAARLLGTGALGVAAGVTPAGIAVLIGTAGGAGAANLALDKITGGAAAKHPSAVTRVANAAGSGLAAAGIAMAAGDLRDLRAGAAVAGLGAAASKIATQVLTEKLLPEDKTQKMLRTEEPLIKDNPEEEERSKKED